MSEEMKLITALCEALGFEVVVKHDRKERKEHKDAAMRYNNIGLSLERALATKGPVNMFEIDEDGMYTSYLIEPEISYELIKK